jgi:hypothetical protein
MGRAVMADYQLNFMDAAGHIRRARDMACVDDDAAIRIVAAHASAHVRKLWRGDRLVRQFEPSDPM